MANKIRLKQPQKRSEGKGCKVYQTPKKKFVAGVAQEVTQAEEKYLMKTGLFEKVTEEQIQKEEAIKVPQDNGEVKQVAK